MSDYLLSLIRTAVPAGVGALLAWLGSRWGIVLDDQASVALTAAVVALAVAGYYAIARVIEHRFPRLGRLLVGLGARTPTYPPPVPEAVQAVRDRIPPGSVPPRL